MKFTSIVFPNSFNTVDNSISIDKTPLKINEQNVQMYICSCIKYAAFTNRIQFFLHDDKRVGSGHCILFVHTGAIEPPRNLFALEGQIFEIHFCGESIADQVQGACIVAATINTSH